MKSENIKYLRWGLLINYKQKEFKQFWDYLMKSKERRVPEWEKLFRRKEDKEYGNMIIFYSDKQNLYRIM